MKRLLPGRRGSITIMMALSLVTLIGMVGVGSEVGAWYMTKRQGQNAADAAAMGGAITLAKAIGTGYSSGAAASAAVTAGINYASLNGYTNTAPQTVLVQAGQYSGGGFTASSGSANAVRAVVSKTPTRLFSTLFLASDPIISESAVAWINNTAQACFLALQGGMTIGGNQTINADGCTLMSNTGVKLNSAPTLNGVANLNSVSGCGANTGICNSVTADHNYYSSPTPDPIGSLAFSPGTATPIPSYSNSVLHLTGGTYSGSLSISNGNTVNLDPGTYYFTGANTSIKMTGGTLNGSGVNIVIINKASLSIQGGHVNLSAGDAATPTSLDGILIYDTESGAVKINGDSTSQYGGILYFPNASVTWNGNSKATTSSNSGNCTELIANALTFTGNNITSNFDTKGCNRNYVPYTQIVALVQ